jgi:hypothetical protein
MSPPLRFVLDEHMRGRLWRAIQNHNAKGGLPLDVTQIGNPPDLPRGTLDPDLLTWAERYDRLVISHDRSTMFGHLTDHLAAGRHSPGVVLLRSKNIPDIISDLEVITYASIPGEWLDTIKYFP